MPLKKAPPKIMKITDNLVLDRFFINSMKNAITFFQAITE